jgi:hypothetical protein
MTIDVNQYPFLFSAGTVLAYNIDNDCYGGKHFVWCALSCDSRSQAASSNPLSIARRLIEDVVSLDRHSDKINQNIAGILNGAKILSENGKIDRQTLLKVKMMVKTAVPTDFLPVIYVIDTNKVNKRIIEVPPSSTASKLSPEYKITDLVDSEYELIDVAQLVTAAHSIPRRF